MDLIEMTRVGAWSLPCWVVELYRDRHDGEWRTRSTHGRGETIAMAAYPDVTMAVSAIVPPRDQT